jgi:hypothetical protein
LEHFINENNNFVLLKEVSFLGLKCAKHIKVGEFCKRGREGGREGGRER